MMHEPLYHALHQYGKRTRNFFGIFFIFMLHYFLYLGFVFDKTIIPLALVGCEMIILQLRAMHPIGNVCSLSDV